MSTIVYNMDCMDYMKTLSDNVFDLAVVDPPYGNANMEVKDNRGLRCHYLVSMTAHMDGSWFKKYGRKKAVAWDTAPSQEYFDELFRVSKAQVIWGGNYFALPPCRCFIVWDKQQGEKFSMAMAEFAWTSFNGNAKIFRRPPMGTCNDPRIHPTQKPVALYEWILTNYAHKGQRILDTHVGSGSSRIAAAELGFDYVGCELDKDYFEAEEARFARWAAQGRLFEETKEKQGELIAHCGRNGVPVAVQWGAKDSSNG